MHNTLNVQCDFIFSKLKRKEEREREEKLKRK
jgi:hypothetical protein